MTNLSTECPSDAWPVAVLSQEFEPELRRRRDLVYEYLERHEAEKPFEPPHMHEAIMSYVRHRGKGLRPALLMLSCGAVGGDETVAVPAGAAVEIFHIWTLVHDDIIDRDDRRRGRPTVHAEFAGHAEREMGLSGADAAHYGSSVAILAGDLQQSWSYSLLCDLAASTLPASLVVELVREMATRLTPQLMEGELLDVEFALSGSASPSAERVLDMLAKKTAVLLSYCAWAGARIGLTRSGGDPAWAGTLAEFARLSGLAFQLQDDLLGLTADEELLGKPVGSDLREGKRTYLVTLGLDRATPAQRAVLDWVLGNKDASAQDVAQALAALHDTGAVADVGRLAQELIGQATHLLDSLPATRQSDLLRAWAGFLVTRRS